MATAAPDRADERTDWWRSQRIARDDMKVPPRRQTTAENERIAARPSGQLIAVVRYFLLRGSDGEQSLRWDFGVWHQPTIGVEFVTGTGEMFSATWSQYDEWGFGVNLYDVPMSMHLLPELADTTVDASGRGAWSLVVGRPIQVSFIWNDFGTGRPPCPAAVKIASDAAAARIITAGWEPQESTLSLQPGMDDLLVTFDEKLAEALGLFDPNRGRQDYTRAVMLPAAPDLGLLLVRTDYSDDRAWDAALSAATAVYDSDDFERMGAAIRIRSSARSALISERKATSAAVSTDAGGSSIFEKLWSPRTPVPSWWYLMSQARSPNEKAVVGYRLSCFTHPVQTARSR